MIHDICCCGSPEPGRRGPHLVPECLPASLFPRPPTVHPAPQLQPSFSFPGSPTWERGHGLFGGVAHNIRLTSRAMWLLRKITAVFFLLSLLLWTLVTLLLMCEPMANEYPQVSLRDYKVMKRVAPSGNKSVEGEFFFFSMRDSCNVVSSHIL